MEEEILLKNWKTNPVVLSVDSEFNGGKGNILDLEDYFLNSHQLSTYQVVELDGIHHSFKLNSQDAFQFRTDEKLYGFFQSNLQKDDILPDYQTFIPLLQDFVVSNTQTINRFYQELFQKIKTLEELKPTVEVLIEQLFDWSGYHPFFKKLMIDYFSAKPLRGIGIVDIEPVDKTEDIFSKMEFYFRWQEIPLRIISQKLEEWGIDYLITVSGKGYHLIYSIPLFLKNGSFNNEYLEILKIGGHIQSETMGWMVKTSPRSLYPRSLLGQILHQGIYKLQHYLVVSLIPTIEKELKAAGFPSRVGLTDNQDKQISIDLTKLIDRIDNSSFATVGSLYSKRLDLKIVRIIRKREGKDYFLSSSGEVDIIKMEEIRRNPLKSLSFLEKVPAFIPVSQSGFLKWIKEYRSSKLKELHDLYNTDLDLHLSQQFINSNYKVGRDLGLSEIIDGGDKLKNPAYLEPLFRKLKDEAKMDEYQLSCFLYALYIDPFPKVWTEYPVSKAERAKWPLLLMWRDYLN